MNCLDILPFFTLIVNIACACIYMYSAIATKESAKAAERSAKIAETSSKYSKVLALLQLREHIMAKKVAEEILNVELVKKRNIYGEALEKPVEVGFTQEDKNIKLLAVSFLIEDGWVVNEDIQTTIQVALGEVRISNPILLTRTEKYKYEAKKVCDLMGTNTYQPPKVKVKYLDEYIE
jgi:hypothetical protein